MPLDEIASAMRKAADRVHVVAEGAGGTRDRRGAQRPRRHRKNRRRRLRRQHRSFAILRTRQRSRHMSEERFSKAAPLPDRIHRLHELALDLWWSWDDRARAGVPPARLHAVAGDRAQPGADAAADHAGAAGGGGCRSRIPQGLRRGDLRPRSGADRRASVVARQAGDARRRQHRLLLRRVRAAPVAADLRRRPRRARRRSLQGGRRPRPAVRRHRLHVSAGLLPPAHDQRRLAGGALRAHQLDRRADRNGDHAGRPAVHHRRAARRSHGARGGLARAARPRAAVPARHRSRRERALGSRAVGAPLRRRPRDAHPAGNHPRHRRRARACARWASTRPCGT